MSIKLDVPYELRTEAKKHKCFYSPEAKLWTCKTDDKDNDEKVEFINHYELVYLTVDYSSKDEVKSLGGKWDHINKRWYTYKGNENLKSYM